MPMANKRQKKTQSRPVQQDGSRLTSMRSNGVVCLVPMNLSKSNPRRMGAANRQIHRPAFTLFQGSRARRQKSTYAFVLTGTPIDNRIDEIYSITQFLDPRFRISSAPCSASTVSFTNWTRKDVLWATRTSIGCLNGCNPSCCAVVKRK